MVKKRLPDDFCERFPRCSGSTLTAFRRGFLFILFWQYSSSPPKLPPFYGLFYAPSSCEKLSGSSGTRLCSSGIGGATLWLISRSFSLRFAQSAATVRAPYGPPESVNRCRIIFRPSGGFSSLFCENFLADFWQRYHYKCSYSQFIWDVPAVFFLLRPLW